MRYLSSLLYICMSMCINRARLAPTPLRPLFLKTALVPTHPTSSPTPQSSEGRQPFRRSTVAPTHQRPPRSDGARVVPGPYLRAPASTWNNEQAPHALGPRTLARAALRRRVDAHVPARIFPGSDGAVRPAAPQGVDACRRDRRGW